MAYSTKTEIELAWADITDAEAGTDRINQAIAYADGIINSYIGGKYDVPFSSVPAIVKGWSIELAIFYLKKWKNPALITEKDETGIAMVMNALEAVRDGKMQIDGATQIQRVESTKEDYTPVFMEDDMLDAKIDEDLEDDLEDERD